MTGIRPRRVLTVTAVVAVLAAGVLSADSMLHRPDVGGGDRFSAPWRLDYDRGWAFLVQTQQSSHDPDQLAMAGCRWFADGDGDREHAFDDEAAFLAGCDTAAVMTRLEGERG